MSWDFDRDPVIKHDDFNRLNDVALFIGPVLEMYGKVSAEGLKAMMEAGKRFTLVDALSRESYGKGHICGAVNIPLELMEMDAPGFINEDETVVVYSCSKDCAVSAVAVDKLTTLGYDKVLRYEGGLEEWRERGFCIVGDGEPHIHEHIGKEAA